MLRFLDGLEMLMVVTAAILALIPATKGAGFLVLFIFLFPGLIDRLMMRVLTRKLANRWANKK